MRMVLPRKVQVDGSPDKTKIRHYKITFQKFQNFLRSFSVTLSRTISKFTVGYATHASTVISMILPVDVNDNESGIIFVYLPPLRRRSLL